MLLSKNHKQGTALWKLCLYFRSDAPLGAIAYKCSLHKDSSRSSIAGFGESDRVPAPVAQRACVRAAGWCAS
jgi:hypothetical protein